MPVGEAVGAFVGTAVGTFVGTPVGRAVGAYRVHDRLYHTNIKE
jgi:hypothetical protein